MGRAAVTVVVVLVAALLSVARGGTTTPPLGTIMASIGVWEERSQLVWCVADESAFSMPFGAAPVAVSTVLDA